MEQNEFEHIAATIRCRIIAVARGFRLDEAEADDVAQDAMLKLWTIRERITTAQNCEALAVTIARHLCIDRLRRSKTIPIDGRDTETSIHSQPDSVLEESENERWLAQELKRLPTSEYTVLQLRQVERKSTEDIAAIMGISPASVPTLLARARKKLLEELKRRNKQ